MPKILVAGGAGYIGSHTLVDLIAEGFDVVSLDNLSRSKPEVFAGIEAISGKAVKNHKVDLCDYSAVCKVFEEEGDIDGIIHFAAYKSVPESVENPLLYYENNILSLINILKASTQFDIKAFVFSSSCSVYGNPDKLPVTEETPLKPAECAYAASKQMGEEVIEDWNRQSQIPTFALRYFNPVGAHETALIGEHSPDKPNNLLPIVTQTAAGIMDKMYIWGSDYDTKDGTCIRDYIHVMDIAHAHTCALKVLLANNKDAASYRVLNLGTGQGVSVLELIEAFEKVSEMKLNYEMGPRRDGDVIAVYADNSKTKSILNWEPQRDVNEMMRSAWAWQQHLLKLDKKS